VAAIETRFLGRRREKRESMTTDARHPSADPAQRPDRAEQLVRVRPRL